MRGRGSKMEGRKGENKRKRKSSRFDQLGEN